MLYVIRTIKRSMPCAERLVMTENQKKFFLTYPNILTLISLRLT
jgi:hypothetical protein